MANLSNINGKFVVEQTTGYVGVGTTDPNFLIEAAGANSEIALNSTSASIYRLRSTSSDSFIITKNGVGDRLTINGGGDATFAGELSIPSFIRHTGDTNTYIGFPSDDTIKLVTASNEIIRIDSSGNINVGEGTNPKGNILMGNTVVNPASGFADQTGIGLKNSATVPELQVSSDSTAMQLGRTTTGGDGQIMAMRKASVIIHSFDTNNVSIGTNATFAGRIDIDGSPVATGDTRAVLSIDENNSASAGRGGGLTFGRQGNVYGGIKTLQNTSSNDNATMYFQTIGGGTVSNRMVIDESGNVGIGTDSPNYQLEVRTTTNNRAIQAVNSTTSGTNWGFQGGAFGVGASKNIGLQINVEGASTNYAALLIGGNVGIGTQSPVSKFEVDGSIKVTGITSNIGTDAGLSLSYDSGINYINTWASTPLITSTYNYQAFHISGSEKMRIHTNGNVGIGRTAPNYKLVVSNNNAEGIEFGPGYVSGCNLWQNYNRTTSTYVKETHYGSEYHFMPAGGATGNVGINTTSPSAPLTVQANGGGSAINIIGRNNGIADESIISFYEYDGTTRMAYMLADEGNLDFATGGSTVKMRIRSTGSLVGTHESSAGIVTGLQLVNPINAAGTGHGTSILLHCTDGDPNRGVKIASSSTSNYAIDNDMLFYTSAGSTLTERMRITSGGDFGFGTTSTSVQNGSIYFQEIKAVNTYIKVGHKTGSASGADFLACYYDGTQIGGVAQAGTTGVAFNTSSDYRLKENVVSMTGALDRVSQLKPSRFNFIADADKTVDGFLAHEVQEIVPEAITGEKDAVDEEGNPEYQGIDQSKLVPLLVGAIQELKAEIEILKNK